MRLIDADELVAELIYLYEDRGWHEREIHFSLADIRCNVDIIPTVDAVEVVRCKDCSRHGTKSCPIKGKIKDNLAEEFYCQCGTPKADLAEWNALVKEVLNATN